MSRLQVLIWHIHGSYLNALARVDHDWYLPVKPGRPEGYGGRGATFDLPHNLIEVPAERVRDLQLDAIILQTPRNLHEDAPALLTPEQRRLPTIYLEHNVPRPDAVNTRHPFADQPGLIVHVTHYNRLMWDNGATPTRVIAHSVAIDPTIRYDGSLPRGIFVANGIQARPRIAGYDLFLQAREQVPLDAVGLDTAAFGGLGDVPYRDLHRLTARYRFLYSPMRYTSLPLAVVEAMTIGMPVVALATTALPDVIQDGVNGFISQDPAVLIDRMRALIADPDLAHQLGEKARQTALDRFALDRFRADWDAALREGETLRSGGDAALGSENGGTDSSSSSSPPKIAQRSSPPKAEGRLPLSAATRVAMLSEHASPLALLGGVDAGGQNVYIDAVSRELVAHGYQTDVFTVRSDVSLPEVVDWADGVRVIHVPAGPAAPQPKDDLWPHMPAFRDGIAAFARREEIPYGLIHGNFWMSGWVAAALGRRWSLPVAHIFHATGVTKRREQGAADTSPAERIAVERAVVRAVDRLIAQCPAERDELLADYGARAERIALIPSAVDVARFRPIDQRAARRALGLDPTARIIVYVGRVLPRKDIRNIVQALALLKNQSPADMAPPLLMIVGGESEQPDPAATPEIGVLQSLAADLGVSDCVRFAGRQQPDELYRWYGAADVAVTTPWYEPFGLTPLEAMACGRPVIGSRVGGIAFTVVDRETGFLVPPRDPAALAQCLATVLADAALRARLGQAGRERVLCHFTWPQVAAHTAALYDELLATQVSSRGTRDLVNSSLTTQLTVGDRP